MKHIKLKLKFTNNTNKADFMHVEMPVPYFHCFLRIIEKLLFFMNLTLHGLGQQFVSFSKQTEQQLLE